MYKLIEFDSASSLFNLLLNREILKHEFENLKINYIYLDTLLYRTINSAEYVVNFFRSSYDAGDYDISKVLLARMCNEQIYESTLNIDLDTLISIKEGLYKTLENRKLVHFHIPKTGGAGLFEILRRVIGYSYSLRFAEPKFLMNFFGEGNEILLEKQLLLENCKFLSGHICIDDLQFLHERGYELYVFTVLRDPVDTLISTYKYWMSIKHPKQIYIKELQKQNLSFSEFIHSSDMRPFTSNVLSKFLIRSVDYESGLLSSKSSQNEAFEVILSNLRKYFSRLGNLRHYSQFLDQLCSDFNVSVLPTPKLNVTTENSINFPSKFKTPCKVEFSEDEYAYMRYELLALDYKIYDYVSQSSQVL